MLSTYLFLVTFRVSSVVSQKMSESMRQDLLTPLRMLGEACGYEGCPQPVEGVLNVHLVPHSHGELGFMYTFEKSYTGRIADEEIPGSDVNWKRILDYTITELWKQGSRRFTLSDMPYFFRWWSERDGTVHRMVLQLLRQGRLHIVGGGWGMPDEACTSYHALIDHFTLSLRKINKTLGVCGRPLVAWQADSAGHSREFTNLAAMFGFDGLFVSPISFEDEIYRMTGRELEMIWRGSDDLGAASDIFTHKLFDGIEAPPGFNFGTFDGDPLIITSSALFSNAEERVNAFIDSVKNRQGYNYVGAHGATGHVMVVMGHRMAYWDAVMWFENIDSLIRKTNEKGVKENVKVNVMYSAPACYLKAIHASKPVLPIKQDDFMPVTFDQRSHFTGHFTSRPTIKHMAREGHVYLQMARQMQVLAALSAKDAKFYEDLAWVTGVFQDHNVISGNMRPEVKTYYTDKMHRAVQLSTLLLRKAFNKLRKSPANTMYYRCAFNISSCKNTNSLRSFVVIYNPLAWPVTVPVRIPVGRHNKHIVYNPKMQTVKAVSMKMSPAVLKIPRRETLADHEIVFIAEDLPPMGFRSYYIESSTLSGKKNKRSLFKNLLKIKKKKKYLSRQTDKIKIDDDSMMAPMDYEDDVADDTNATTMAPDDVVDTNATTDDDVDDANATTTAPDDAADDTNATTTAPDDAADDTNATTTAPDDFADASEDNQTKMAAEDIEYVTEYSDDFSIQNNSIDPTATYKTIQTSRPAERDRSMDYNFFSYSNNPETLIDVKYKAEEIDSRKFFDKPLRRVMATRTTPRTVTTTEYEPMEDPGFDERKNYFYRISKDKFIKNKYVKVHLDGKKHVSLVTLSNGVKVALNIKFYYYASDDPVSLRRVDLQRKPGALIFNPMDPEPVLIEDFNKTVVHKTFLVQEVQYTLSNWVGFVVRIYYGRPVIEIDWVVGPIPTDDNLGKDVFIRYSTDLESKGEFYTDSNGRQTVKRVRNSRPSYQPLLTNIPSNIYPVTSKIHIEDRQKNIRFSVFNDRAQGGTSLHDGEIDLMVHRHIFTDDIGAGCTLNETENGKSIVVRGKHFIYISKADYYPNKIFEKKLAKEIELAPQVFASNRNAYGDNSKEIWYAHNNEFKGVVKKLPTGIHVLTLQEWNDHKLLLRLENYLEKADTLKMGVKTVFVKDLFANITVKEIKETTLGGNIWIEERTPAQWNVRGKFVKNFNDFYNGNGSVEFSSDAAPERGAADIDHGITLTPQQIRTFIVSYEYHQ